MTWMMRQEDLSEGKGAMEVKSGNRKHKMGNVDREEGSTS
jgi:hypothetical protein